MIYGGIDNWPIPKFMWGRSIILGRECQNPRLPFTGHISLVFTGYLSEPGQLPSLPIPPYKQKVKEITIVLEYETFFADVVVIYDIILTLNKLA
jgi:hypothetical protein